MSEKSKKSFTKGTWNVFKQINRLKNACKIEEKETESSRWGKLFEKENEFNSKIMTELIPTERTEEVFVNGYRYHIWS